MEPETGMETDAETAVTLTERLDRLEKETALLLNHSERRIVESELKVAALRAGMIDLDGLAFLDTHGLVLNEEGKLPASSEMISQLRHDKPWLFKTSSSSSTAIAPQNRQTRPKLATEMSEEEYRIAKARMLKISKL